MRESIITLTTLFIIVASCGTETKVEDEFQPYRVGTWMIASPDSAGWVGVSSMNKAPQYATVQADTIELASPQGHYVTMTRKEDAESGGVYFEYIDSTSFPRRDDIDMAATKIIFPEVPNGGSAFNNSLWGTQIGGGRIQIRTDIGWRCGIELEPNPKLWVHFKDTTGAYLRHYKLKVDGFMEALNEVGC